MKTHEVRKMARSLMQDAVGKHGTFPDRTFAQPSTAHHLGFLLATFLLSLASATIIILTFELFFGSLLFAD